MEGEVLGLRPDVEKEMFSATSRRTNGRICSGMFLKRAHSASSGINVVVTPLPGTVTTSCKGHENVLKLVIVMVAQLWEQTNNHWTVRFK